MKPLVLALGLFVAFLLVRSTLTVSAQGMLERPRAAKISGADTRARRTAALEAQDHTLAMRQHEIEKELDRIAEAQQRWQARIDREAARAEEGETAAPPADPAAERLQLLQKKAEIRQELDRVLAERQRVQDDWQTLTGMRLPAR